MAQSTFSLSWESHKNNVCNGLSVLQQNEEFVDMTLAADGHYVKCHQMILALASPYFKDLIKASYFSGRHPVIYLNKISYKTLSAILEYIYLGEVIISIDELSELIQTAKELRIKGLEEMKTQNTDNILHKEKSPQAVDHEVKYDNNELDDEICYFEVTENDDGSQKSYSEVLETGEPEDKKPLVEIHENMEEGTLLEESSNYSNLTPLDSTKMLGSPVTMRYTVSNQGSLQMILNRYLYYLKHSNRNNSQQWRCVDYLSKRKCPAIVVSKNNLVKQRIAAHTHAHHDQRILKKVRASAIYEAIHAAETEGNRIKRKTKQEKPKDKVPPKETVVLGVIES